MQRQAAMVKVQPQIVDKLRKDFLMLMRNVKRVKDYRVAIEFREAASRYSKNVEKLVMMLADELKRIMRVDKAPGAEYLERYVREETWAFIIEVGSPPIMRSDQYHSEAFRFADWERDKEKWANRTKRLARKAWKVLQEVLEDWPGGDAEVKQPTEYQQNIGGLQVRFKAISPASRKNIPIVMDALKKYKARASSVYAPMAKMLPIVVSGDLGSISTAGRYEGSHVEIAALLASKLDETVQVIAHEMAHHVWQKILSGKAQDFWCKAIRSDYGDLDLRDVLKKWPSSAKDLYELYTETLAHTDPLTYLRLESLSYYGSPGFFSEIDPLHTTRDVVEQMVESGQGILKVPKHPISGYANKNCEEAFCEAMGKLVAYGAKAVPDQVIRWLRIIMPSLKVASCRNADVALALLRVARRLLKDPQ